MPIHVDCEEFSPESGYEYRVHFNRNGVMREEEVRSRVPVEVAISIGENGELADLSFEVPKVCRSSEALACICQHDNARYIDPRVFVVFPGANGDTVVLAAGRLEMDLAGRIIGMEILWNPIHD